MTDAVLGSAVLASKSRGLCLPHDYSKAAALPFLRCETALASSVCGSSPEGAFVLLLRSPLRSPRPCLPDRLIILPSLVPPLPSPRKPPRTNRYPDCSNVADLSPLPFSVKQWAPSRYVIDVPPSQLNSIRFDLYQGLEPASKQPPRDSVPDVPGAAAPAALSAARRRLSY
jgi:hypothetical protein